MLPPVLRLESVDELEVQFDGGQFRFVLDRPHCKEHPSSAGEALELMTHVPAQEWATRALDRLEAGEAAAVAAELKQAWEATSNGTRTLSPAPITENRGGARPAARSRAPTGTSSRSD